MEGFIGVIPRALVPAYLEGPADFIYRGGFTIELREYAGSWYAYSVDGGSPEESFSAIRYGYYSAVEHEMVTEIVLELLRV